MVLRSMRRLPQGLCLLTLVVLPLVTVSCTAHSQAPALDKTAEQAVGLRVGYFPNLTHGQAVVGIADGTFARTLGPQVRLEPRLFNAGPSLIQALLAGEIDIGYVGPVPALTGYLRTHGRALRIIAGAASGGAVLVVRPQAGIVSVADLGARKVAIPQLGNTQDLSLRHFLRRHGLEATERGGTVTVIPMANPDILTFFRRQEIDAAWVPEPWGARLCKEAGARVLVDERELWPGGRFSTAVVVARSEFLAQNPVLVSKWLEAHLALTKKLHDRPADAAKLLNREIGRLTGKLLPQEIIDEALTRLEFTYDPLKESVVAFGEWLYEEGYLRGVKPDFGGIFALEVLESLVRPQAR